ncbi:MAG: hypothetical protein HN712_27095 [Gemmatimonadetes bacterium]|nr:hypothetical protein [Gemmatimonadota bacterium]MBT6147572.1 hypothetical protein [Gemmatimonadota bacterium]MBT7864008.1 hypothetical protein [Gemmatimonadota bacterium]
MSFLRMDRDLLSFSRPPQYTHEITLDLETKRYVNESSYTLRVLRHVPRQVPSNLVTSTTCVLHEATRLNDYVGLRGEQVGYGAIAVSLAVPCVAIQPGETCILPKNCCFLMNCRVTDRVVVRALRFEHNDVLWNRRRLRRGPSGLESGA